MRYLLLRLVLPVIAVAAVWIFGGSSISALLDRFFTVAQRTSTADGTTIGDTAVAASPKGSVTPGDMSAMDVSIADMAIDGQEMSIAGRRWLLGTGCVVTTNPSGEVTLASQGRTFTLTAIEGGADGTAGTYARVRPASADNVTFTTWHSWLAWPLLNRYSIMGAPRPTWQRHLYHRLHWLQPSGATLDIEWRDEQQFYAKSGWSDMFLESPPKVTIGSISH